MISYRKCLEQIGIPANAFVAYSDFYCKPKSLSQAMNAMQLPGDFSQVSDISLDEYWTEAVQGCGTDGTHWFFAANPDDDDEKRLYVFDAGTPLLDDNIVSSFSFNSVPLPGGIDHVGQFDLFEGKIYVSHFKDGNSHVIILRNDSGSISYHGFLQVEMPISPTDRRKDTVQFQCIVPWDRTFLTCFGSGNIDVLFIHDLVDGRWTGRTIRLQTPISKDWWVQGAAFSPYGHLFIATSPKDGVNPGDTQYVRIVSPLNGRELSVISVCAEEKYQELEGCCFAPISWPDGRTAEFHVVLLDNKLTARDNIFFKSFHRSR